MTKMEVWVVMVLVSATIMAVAGSVLLLILWRTWEFVRLVLEMAVRV